MARKVKLKEKTSLKGWSIDESRELYNIKSWGHGFFDINAAGNVVVYPDKSKNKYLDIKKLIDDLGVREITSPLLLRFTDILKQRIDEIHEAFEKAKNEYEFNGTYYGVYPIKVNQSKQVVEDVVEFGRAYNYGLEAGTKPELLICLACLDSREAPIICNGYKDEEYIETALWGTKLGKKVIIVVEKPSELDTIIKKAGQLKVKPHIGIRCKLAARGRGKWESSGGDRSKFGLFPSEIIEAIGKLKANDMLDSLELLHSHLGSQISSIQSIKEALRESTRMFVELCRLGVNIKYFDVGGGLAVDYDGSQTNFPSSRNYTLEEYAADIISAVVAVCQENNLPHPNVISESGRALVAYHSLLVFNVLGTSEVTKQAQNVEVSDDDPDSVRSMKEVLEELSLKNFQEAFHDALQIRDEALTLFNVGILSLEHRAKVEQLFWAICQNIDKIIGNLDYVPDELENLQHFVSTTYFGNFSVFQSAPDHWAIKQLFPVMPIHRLGEQPTRRGTIADITCDSDGTIDQFIDLHDVKEVLELHEFHDGEEYYIGVFLLGAYQEVLGDLHNLFGDSHVVHVSVTGKGTYKIDKLLEGDTVADVLLYMQYQKRDLMARIRKAVEDNIEARSITLQESAKILRFMEEGFEGYTYLE